ncbi:MAG: acetolactate synthase small subunit [Lachnospiraceae bacterium]|jgi:acetolactate synthase-1/3 small subunit|nr:acetolactate synthase small subunit [Lachnospiraceae bacterium]MCI9134825.1 acetolactate synthase small subunit [Lachnospiraceae bacterium]
MDKVVFSILVDNISGVLSRISGLFSRRGYNIDSLTVGVTADPRYSRITVVAKGDESILDQIEKQLKKLVDVIDIKRLQPDTSICRELVLVKLKANVEERQAVFSMVNVFRAKVVDVSRESVMVELIGNHSKINAFIDLLEGYEILELARTGVTGLSRGTFDVKMYDEEGNLIDYGFQ